MKHFFYIIFTLLFSFSFSQEQIVNGIALNGPNGFVKSGNLQWTNEDNQNENLIILHMKGNLIDKNQYKSQCEEGTRTTEFVDFFEDMEIQGENYSFCVQKGTNTLAIVGTMMYKDGFTYILMSSASPEDYQRCFYIMGYIITRISLQ
tara:strand:+ start:106 stop:549 length:444 start_codon:yes stop_codon:yes gene_type:complete